MLPNDVLLAHERLHVYQLAIGFLSLTAEILRDVPRGYAPIADQLLRAATWVPLNIAEGCGRTGTADAARHYAVARGSALECAAVLDALHALEIIDPARRLEGRARIVRVVQMLSKMCR